MSFTCKDCGDLTCAQHGSHDVACDDFTPEVQAEDPAEAPDPPRILSCDRHAEVLVAYQSVCARLAVLEDLVSRMRREMNRADD